MLSLEEKAYCRALEALKKRDYVTADREFDNCASMFADSRGFKIISEAARMLARLRNEKSNTVNIKTEIKESVSHGEETIVCGQGEQEETR
jgi:hypothetical protein